MDNFYLLKPDRGDRFGRNWAYGQINNPYNSGEAEHCPVCNEPVTMKRWLHPHYLKLSSAQPEKWGDFLWGTVFPFMVSARLKKVYQIEALTGIAQFHPRAKIVRMGKHKAGDLPAKPPQYYLVDIPWNGANLDDARSGAKRYKATCKFDRDGVKKLDRIVLEADSWTGLDIFGVRGLPGLILVSERFKTIIEKFKFTNVWLIPAEKYVYEEGKPGGWYMKD